MNGRRYSCNQIIRQARDGPTEVACDVGETRGAPLCEGLARASICSSSPVHASVDVVTWILSGLGLG